MKALIFVSLLFVQSTYAADALYDANFKNTTWEKTFHRVNGDGTYQDEYRTLQFLDASGFDEAGKQVPTMIATFQMTLSTGEKYQPFVTTIYAPLSVEQTDDSTLVLHYIGTHTKVLHRSEQGDCITEEFSESPTDCYHRKN